MERSNTMKILFLGHSLVEYYDWQDRFPGHTVYNLGIAGETTGGLLARAGLVAGEVPDADIVLVMTGTNDDLMGDHSFLEVYALLAEKLRRSSPEARIVLHSVLPAHPEWIDHMGETTAWPSPTTRCRVSWPGPMRWNTREPSDNPKYM